MAFGKVASSKSAEKPRSSHRSREIETQNSTSMHLREIKQKVGRNQICEKKYVEAKIVETESEEDSDYVDILLAR